MMAVTDQYGVIGNPIRHSKSPEIHRAFARALGEDLEYTIIESSRGGFHQAVEAFRKAGGRGLNVTAPFKLEAFALAHQRSERAEVAGSANTLRFEGRTVLADNFDGVGLVRDIRENLGARVEGQRVLLLGAGGAARGVL
jgi:shikimate dehydrogenase